MTEHDRDLEAEDLIGCIRAAFRQLKSLDPVGNPWAGNMLGTENIRQLGTSIYIQLNRRGERASGAVALGSKDSGSAPVSSEDSLAAANATPAARQDVVDRTEQSSHVPKPRKASKASSEAATPPAFGSSRPNERTRKMEWYAGPCRQCQKPAWVRFAMDPEGGQPEGSFQCLACWQKEHPR